MKTKLLITGLTLLALSTLNSQLSTAFAQGSLTPPGLPAPTMKTADQIYSKLESRTPISSAPFIITNSGSYYLTTNLLSPANDGIEIRANNVMLDLNGFCLQPMTSEKYGIVVGLGQALTNVTVRNGTISGFSNTGVESDHEMENLVYERLNISNCGDGIHCGEGWCVVRNCNVGNNSQNGIYVYSGSTVSGCVAKNNGVGIDIAGYYEGESSDPGSLIIGNNCVGNQIGIFIEGSNNRIEDNHVVSSGSGGIQLHTGAYYNNIIIKNSVYGNGANNYPPADGQILGPLITAEGTITSVNPWANFSF